MTLHHQIGCQFQGKRHIPFTATDQEKRHGRDTSWELRALADCFCKAVGGTGAHQGQLAVQRLDCGDDHHNDDTKVEAHNDAA